jgi:hypothetical protein
VVVQGRHRFPESGFAVGEFLVDQAVDEPLLVEGGQAAAGPEKGVVAAGLDESANVGSADLAWRMPTAPVAHSRYRRSR